MSKMSQHMNAQQRIKNNTPATMAIPGRETEMAKNNNGGFSFVISDWDYYKRFLIIGPSDGNNAVGASELTDEGFKLVKKLVAQDYKQVVDIAVGYSVSGRAPKNDPAIIAVALTACYGDSEAQQYAHSKIREVCRTGTHMFLYAQVINTFGKWNAAAKRAFASWYNERPSDRLAVQMLKYQQRNGWSHRDVLRLAHVKPNDDVKNAMFRHAVGSEKIDLQHLLPSLYDDVRSMNTADNADTIVHLIENNQNVSWEMVPTKFLNDPKVLAALIPNMGMTALIRQLGRFSSAGLTTPMTDTFKMIRDKLSDAAAIKNGRIHPITLLTAMKMYKSGSGRSGASWNPEGQIVKLLDDGFYKAFTYLEDTGANVLLGVDCSGSMFSATVNNSVLTAAEVAACMAMAIMKSHANYFIGGFGNNFRKLELSSGDSLDATMKKIRQFPWQSTNISSVYDFARMNRIPVDVFGVITDNDVNSGRAPTQALQLYRTHMNKNAAQIVCATSMSKFTVADPKDPLQIDIPGFDSHVPAIFSEFEKLVLNK